MKRNVLIVAAVVAGLLVVTALMLFTRSGPDQADAPEQVPEPPIVEEVATPPETTVEEIATDETPAAPPEPSPSEVEVSDDLAAPVVVLPPLAESDEFVREHLRETFGWHTSRWLDQDDFVAKGRRRGSRAAATV